MILSEGKKKEKGSKILQWLWPQLIVSTKAFENCRTKVTVIADTSVPPHLMFEKFAKHSIQNLQVTLSVSGIADLQVRLLVSRKS